MKLTDISYVRAVMEKHGIAPQKRYGQNFLISENVVSRIADTAGLGDYDIGIIEIGPGIGTLTQKLAERYKKVVSVEIDTSLLPVLADTLADYDNVKIINGDAMKTDFAKLIEEEFAGMRVAVCANLPYYITSPVIMRLLETNGIFESVTVMIQKEVADRLVAAPNTAEYGAITAACAYYADIQKVFQVSPANFIPPPKVTSSVIRMDIHKEPPVSVQDQENLFRVIRGAFAKRRKTLSNSLSGETSKHTKAEIEATLVSLGYRADVRGETLGLADFAKISDALTL
jgi:16S rRNA (adenine1518-N6/adenine1519-N6)-dimethyltransferase